MKKEENMKGKNSKKTLGLMIIFGMGLLILGNFIGYYFGTELANVENSKTNDSEEKDTNNKTEEGQKEEDQTPSNEENQTTAKCYGTYYGEVSGTEDNGLSYDFKYTYVLNEDGTFTADYSGINGTSGTFVINDNTISLTGPKSDEVGPREEDPYYYTEDLVIADDCSYILYDNTTGFKLLKK